MMVDFRVRAAFFSTALFGVPFPLPTPQGRRDRQLRDRHTHCIIFVCVQPYSTTLFGLPFPLKVLGSATQGQTRDRDLRAALGNPQEKRQANLFRKE